MHGALIPIFHTRLAIPNPLLLLHWLAPVLAVLAFWWLVQNTDRIMHFLFPNLEWEKSLGWLNIKAERRAMTAIRWIGYLIKFALAAALLGILWVANGFPDLADWPAPQVVSDLFTRLPVLAVCLGLWLFYLGYWLIPKLRGEREEAALKLFRAQMQDVERDRETVRRARSRLKTLPKPRANEPLSSPAPERRPWRDEPGG